MIVQLTILVISIIILAVISFIVSRKIRRKEAEIIIHQKEEENIKRKLGIDKDIKNPKESLISLNKIAREFFKHYLKERTSETLGEIEEELKKRRISSYNLQHFCST